MSLQDPWHPGTMLTALKIGKQRLITLSMIQPPNSRFTFSVTPPLGTIWVMAIQSIGRFTDYLTGNPIESSAITFEAEHPMIGSVYTQAVESTFKMWPTDIDVSVGEPLTMTATNGTAFFAFSSVTLGIFDMPQRIYDEEYLPRWHGLDNILRLMGKLQPDQIDKLVKKLGKFIESEDYDIVLQKKTEE